jgi:DNA-binding response OmpR family regulator
MKVILLLSGRDDPAIGRLGALLADAGLHIERAKRVNEAEHAAGASAADAVIFDPAAVDADFLRRPAGRVGACALVAWTSVFSSVRSARLLDEGADEVLHAGMSGEELLARVRKAAGKAGRSGEHPLELGPLHLDAAHGEVLWDGREISLSRREREVLHVLAESAGRAVRRESLYRRVWGYTMARGDRTVDVNVKRLRAKLAAADAGVVIETRPGVGYKLDLDLVTDEPAQRSPAPAPAGAGHSEA